MYLMLSHPGHVHPYIISADDIHILDALAILYGKAIAQSYDSLPPKSVYISIEQIKDYVNNRTCNHYRVRCKERTIMTDTPVQAVTNILFEESDYATNIFPLHGGAVEAGGKAYLFLAPTGQGKTTLTAYLAAQGFSYINDDSIIIDMNTDSVLPNLSPVCLRPGSIPVLKQYGCTISGTEINIEDIERIVYMPDNTVHTALPIGNIYFIERIQNDNDCNRNYNACRHIDKSEAIQLLMSSLCSPDAVDISRMKYAIHSAEHCFRLIYSDMRYIADLLNNIM